MFETPHLRLRGTQPSDGDSLLTFYNNPLVAPWITIGTSYPRHASEKLELLKQTETALVGCIIEEKATEAFVGLAGFVPLRMGEMKNRNVTVYIGLEPEFWGRGYAREAMGSLVEYAFWEMGMHKVSLTVIEGNERAVRLYKKLGFVEEGRDRQSVWTHGEWRDMIRMGILEDEWAEWRAKNPPPPTETPSSTTITTTTTQTGATDSTKLSSEYPDSHSAVKPQ